jgi:hypothetical protein
MNDGQTKLNENQLIYSEINQGDRWRLRKTQQKSIFHNDVMKVG